MSLSAEQLQLFSRLAGQKGLARVEHSTVREQSPCPVQEGVPQEFSMTDVQRAYWIGRTAGVNLSGVGSHGYQEFDCGALDVERLQKAWDRVIARHDMLRATVTREGMFHIVPKVPPLRWEIEDLRQLDAADKEQRLAARRKKLSHRVPDLSVWPIITLGASIIADDFVRVHLSCDAVMADVYSIGNCLRELSFFYTHPQGDMPVPGMTFGEYVEEQKRKEETSFYHECRKYWQDRLADFPAAPQLPTQEVQPQVQRFKRLKAGLEPEQWAAFKAMCNRHALTPSVVLYTVFAAVMGQWAARPYFCLNITVFNRESENPAIQQVVGDFTTTMLSAARKMRPQESFIEYARELDARFWQDVEHSAYSGIKVLQDISERQRRPVLMPIVFTSALGAGDVGEILDTNNGVFGKPAYTITQTPQIWLDHQVLEEDGRLVFNWDVVEGIFDEVLQNAIFRCYGSMVEALCKPDADWQRPIMPELPEEQMARRHDADPCFEDDGHLLHQGFLEHVLAFPNKKAVIAPDRTLAFGELFQGAYAVARQLTGALPQNTQNVLVAVGLPKGWEQIAAVMGILLTGAAYVPIDPTWPRARRSAILQQGVMAVVAEQGAVAQDWDDLPLAVVRQEDTSVDAAADAAADALVVARQTSPDRLAYVIFTSGTTGTPKGVMMTHRAVQNTIRDINSRFGVSSNDSVFAISALSFDLSVYDIFGLLSAGGHLVLPDEREIRDPSAWVRRLARHPATLWNSVPMLWQMFVEHGTAVEHMPRLALLSGDCIPPRLPGDSAHFSPATRLISLGGATEAAIWSIAYETSPNDPPAGWKSIPYGRALANQKMLVLHEDMTPCPDDVPGELYIGGRGLAMGYLGDEALTDQRFITHPRSGERLYRTGDMARWRGNGQIEFMGRNDTQVKVNGFRIELGDIEAALASLPGVQAAVAAIMPLAGAGKGLVGYVVPQQSPRSLPPNDLHTALRARLPLYMVPQHYVVLEQLPLSDNGKVDRKRLPAPQLEEAATQEKGTELEERIREIVGLHLGISSFGLQDRFFDLGATSLLMVKIHRSLNQILPQQIALIQLFEAPSVHALASLVTKGSTDAPGTGRSHAEKRLAARNSRRGKVVQP